MVFVKTKIARAMSNDVLFFSFTKVKKLTRIKKQQKFFSLIFISREIILLISFFLRRTII